MILTYSSICYPDVFDGINLCEIQAVIHFGFFSLSGNYAAGVSAISDVTQLSRHNRREEVVRNLSQKEIVFV